MDKEIIDKQIKNEIELFKVYAFFLVGLITAIINFVRGWKCISYFGIFLYYCFIYKNN